MSAALQTTSAGAEAVRTSYSFAEIASALGGPNSVTSQLGTRRRKTTTTGDRRAAANDSQVLSLGGRNNSLTRAAGSMRRSGDTQEQIDAALQIMNLAKCIPPLDPTEVSAIAKSVARYEPASDQAVSRSLNDIGNAERFGNQHADRVRHVPGQGWLLWTGQRWQRDAIGSVTELAKSTARAIFDEGSSLNDKDTRAAIARHAFSSHRAASVRAMVDLAKTRPELVVLMTALDCDDMLLGVSNGVVDLKTGKLLPASRQQLMTRQSPVVFDKAGKCPDFLKFLARVTGNNKSLMKYLQRVVGYCLTGMATEQCLFFLHGKGANGKSTFLNVLRELVGTDYAAQTPPETLMAKRNSGATNDIARLNGLRIVVANEVEDSTHLAESLVKQLTGGDAVSARFLHHEFFEFTPKFKLFIAGNHKPVIRGRDEGIWRRIQLVPFEVTIPIADRDAQLQQKLRAEASGILNWAIAGCKEWQRMGLVPPQVVVDAVKAYRDEMDILTDWINERCATGPALEWQSTQAYQSYKAWAEDGSYKPMTIAAFGREFGERYTRVKKSSGNFYRGICHRLPAPRHRLEDVEGLV